ncbi:hypothetical protein D3C73_917660 [compost metagenome]
MTVSPTVALRSFALLTREICGWITGVEVTLEDEEPEKTPEVKLTVDWLLICEGIGIVILTSNVTATEAPGPRLPIGMPADGTDSGWERPPTITVPGMKAAFSGRGSLRMMLLTAAMLLFVSTEVKVTMSPVTASMAFTLFTMLTLGAETGTASVLEAALPPSCRPSGSVKVKDAAAELSSCWFGGSAVTVTRKETGTLSPGASGPTGMPVAGL